MLDVPTKNILHCIVDTVLAFLVCSLLLGMNYF